MIKKMLVLVLFIMAIILVGIQYVSPTAAAAAPQTLSILGAQGTTGATDPYTEFSLDNGQTWRRAFLYAGHPWGNVEGTNNWINCGPTGSDCAGMQVLYRVRFTMPDEFSNPQTVFQFKADNAITVALNNTNVSSITTEGTVTGNTYVNSALKPGLNEIGMVLYDYGGLTGFNYKVSIQIDAASSPTLVMAPPSVLPAPTFTGSPVLPTKGNVSVTIVYPADAAVKEYSFNQSDWFPYASAVTMTNNGTIYARWKDSLGVVSDTGTFAVSNIDRTAPAAPTLSATPTTPTNGDVSVTISYPGDSVSNKYRVGAGGENVYSGAITLSVNDVVYAFAVDAAGNTSAYGSIAVTNIDKSAPPMPTLAADITKPTHSNVHVTFSNWGDATVKQYRINGGSWQAATDTSQVAMTANGTVEARGMDSVGNESAIGTIVIGNIVADPNPLKVTVAAVSPNGTEMILQFNHVLDLHTTLSKEKFHLNGAAASISRANYVSNQVVLLILSSPAVATDAAQPITLDVDYEAVKDQGGKSILEWRELPVKSSQETYQLREQLKSNTPGNPAPAPAIRIDHVVRYMRQSPQDVTGDGIFDRNDILFILLQIDSLAVGMTSSP
ncbi:hypothetical protein FE783_05090 [Paenibacillus mesophilus]|uniref:hypothetical protein n=1 Tax=Paenibacillus mesophilus TaxID=2582849 RepID=UPI00110E6FD9|nr:hypothetical protein [Paenibacillus mesophilus]TMV52317.1 hypothetical protein FE783_05090 [Paenibacillus mesophilus]